MKTLRLFVVLAALLFAGVVAPTPTQARTTVSFDFFYDSLAPYGEWIEVGDYGLCWRPTDVDPDWTPYSDGYWAFTDAGWTWVSYEDFGGIVYHYGRWIRLDDESWCWKPDYEWGPAWVSWRSSDDYVGWAPLPPEAYWRPEVGISVWVDRECDLGPGYYHFCRTRDFGAPVLRPVIINRWENVTIIRHTVNVTNITYNTTYVDGPVIYNGGPSFAVINRVSSRPVPALKLVQEANFDPARHRGKNGRFAFNSQTVGNQLIVAAPQVQKPSDPAAFKARVKRVLPGDAVTKGWNMVKNPDQQKELRQEMGRQSKGLTPATAPARAVAATDLKVVPVKADPTATPPGATATTGERRDRTERPGRGPRPDSVVVQPNNIPPANTPPTPTAPTTTPFVKPTAPVVTATPPATTPGEPTGVVRGRGRNRNEPNSPPPGGPTAVNPNNPNLKPFNPVPDTRPQNPPTATFTPMPKGSNTDDGGAKARAAEQAKIRAEQQERAEKQRMDQQRQAEIAAKQKQQADLAAQQQKQMEQQKQMDQQKQIAAQQEAARARVEEQRRREAFEQQRQQQKQQQMQIQQQQQQQIQQQQQQQQLQQQRAQDARRAQDAERAAKDAERAARDRAKEQADAQRAQQMRQLPPQPQPQPNNQGGGPPRQGGGGGHSKDGKDKDKDKDKDRN